MPWFTQLRTSLAAWLSLPLICGIVLYAQGDLVQWATTGYWESASGKAAYLLFMIAPAAALAGAWEGGRIRRARVAGWAPARSQLRIATAHLLPVFAMVAVGVTAAFAATASTALGAPGFPDPWMILLCLAVGCSHAVLGYAAGLLLPVPVSLPLCLAVSYVWTAYTGTVEPLWLRYLTGMYLDDCCALDQVPKTGVLVSPVVMALGLATAGGLLIAARRRLPAALGAVVAVAVGFALAAWPVHHLGADPTRARTGTQCAGTGPQICLWPEQQRAADRIRLTVRTGYARLAAAGLHLPDIVKASDDARQHGALTLLASTSPTTQEITDDLSQAILPADPPACSEDTPYPGNAAYGPLQAWLDLAQGGTGQLLAGEVTATDIQLAEHVRALPRDEQLSWFAADMNSLTHCDTPMAILPAAPGKERAR